MELSHEDAREYLSSGSETFDVMIMDLVDPLEAGTAFLLYTQEYYRIARSRLNPGGVLVTQSGPSGLLSYQECFTTIFNTLSSIFKYTAPAQVHVPAFATLWGFTLASDSPIPLLTDGELDDMIARRVSKPLMFYDGESPPEHVRPAQVLAGWHPTGAAHQPGLRPGLHGLTASPYSGRPALTSAVAVGLDQHPHRAIRLFPLAEQMMPRVFRP